MFRHFYLRPSDVPYQQTSPLSTIAVNQGRSYGVQISFPLRNRAFLGSTRTRPSSTQSERNCPFPSLDRWLRTEFSGRFLARNRRGCKRRPGWFSPAVLLLSPLAAAISSILSLIATRQPPSSRHKIIFRTIHYITIHRTLYLAESIVSWPMKIVWLKSQWHLSVSKLSSITQSGALFGPFLALVNKNIV